MMKRESLVVVRLNAEELAKLDALAQRTERDRSKVVRLLLSQASAHDVPDIQLERTERVTDALGKGARQ